MTSHQPAPSQQQYISTDLEGLFHECFYEDYAVMLVGGYSEPLYLPGEDGLSGCQIRYREDYFSSALHEIAHWCIAGEERRKLVDFGYWYEPDGRTPDQQAAFEKVEVKPQALEWVFSTAAGIPFRVSHDNLHGGTVAQNTGFTDAVYQQILIYISHGLPGRSALFTEALAAFYNTDNPLDRALYNPNFLL
jgi:elongation factor P hydroxylase